MQERIIKENKRRNAVLDAPYNPIVGLGSPIKRQEVTYSDINTTMYLPVEMLNIDWVNYLAGVHSLSDVAKEFDTTTETLMQQIINERYKHDFEFWASTTAKIKPKTGGDFIPFILNRPQRKIHEITYNQVVNNEPIRQQLLKSRQFGGSTYYQIFMGYIQVIHKTSWNSLIAAHLNQAATNIRYMFSILSKYYPKEIESFFTLKSFENTKNIKIIPERNCKITIGSIETPDSIRADDVALFHGSEVALWKKTEGKGPEDLCQSILGTMPTVPWSMYVLESTAKGIGNFFHRSWLNAISGENGLIAVFISWIEDPKNRIKFRDNNEMMEFYNTLSDYENFLWEQGATLEGINFYRFKLKELNGNEWAMKSEFPTTCIAKGSIIGTNKGLVNIEDCKIGDVTTYGKITAVIDNGVKSIYRLTTKMGYEIDCTEDHLINTYQLGGDFKWKKLHDILENEIITLSKPNLPNKEFVFEWNGLFVKHSIHITPEFARFLGIFMGDGSYSGQTISIACDARDIDFIENTKELINNLFNVKTNTRPIGENKGGVEIRVQKKSLTKYFLKLGIVSKWDHEGEAFKRNVCVPEVIKKSPPHIVKEFLKGIFETDGFNGYQTPKVSLFSMHLEFLKDIQLLLLHFGITSILRSRKAINGSGRKYIARTLTLQGEQADEYRDKIGFLSNRKQSRFNGWVVKNNTKRTKNNLYDRAANIIYVGERQVYDLTIEGEHKFDANGILVHNCEEAFQSTGQKVFSPAYIQAIRKDCMNPEFKGDVFAEARRGKEALNNIRFDKTKEGNLWIWAMPDLSENVEYRYCAFADIGGRTTKADFSVIKVIDRYWMIDGGSPEVVAIWRGHLDQDLFAWKCAQICTMYDNALLAIEVNSLAKEKADSEGEHFLTILDEIANYYNNLYTRNDIEKVGEDFIPKYGFHTNVKTKSMIINSLNAAARERFLKDSDEDEGFHYIERDSRSVDEMASYEVKPDGSLGGVEGTHDDLVIVTAGGVWLSNSYMPMPTIVDKTKKITKRKLKSEASF
jgi:intein/homing endonuclease